jgi:hypothetical protein
LTLSSNPVLELVPKNKNFVSQIYVLLGTSYVKTSSTVFVIALNAVSAGNSTEFAKENLPFFEEVVKIVYKLS